MINTHEILVARARALAQRPVDDSAPRAEFVLLRRNGLLLGLHVGEVESSGRVKDITRVPGAPDWLRGATLHRGHVVSLIDVVALWGEVRGVTDLPTFICLRSGGRRLGVLVEEMVGLDETDARLEPWQGDERVGVEAVTSFNGERVHIVSTARLFTASELLT